MMIQTWMKYTVEANHALTVEVKNRQITIDIDLFGDLMTQAGWHLADNLTRVAKAGSEESGIPAAHSVGRACGHDLSQR